MGVFEPCRARMWLIASSLGIALPAGAALVEASDAGFTVRESASVAAPAAKVFEALLHPERWWSGAHTFSGDAANLSLEPRAGGCFCERLPGGGSVLHLTVAAVRPGSGLVLRGALGPFQSQGVDGALTLGLVEHGDTTEVSFTYILGGHLTLPGGFSDRARQADGMLAEQLARLTRLIQTGSPGA